MKNYFLNEHSTPTDVLEFAASWGDKSWNYIILGRSGATGKTYLYQLLKKNGYNAMEISECICWLVEYDDYKNHFMVDDFRKQVVIVLNRPLKKIDNGYYCWA